MAGVLAALKQAGIAARDIRTANVSLSPQYRYTDGQAPVITGYQANNSVSVRFREIAKSGAILDALVREGANQIDGPTLSLDQPDAALDDSAGRCGQDRTIARRAVRKVHRHERRADRVYRRERDK